MVESTQIEEEIKSQSNESVRLQASMIFLGITGSGKSTLMQSIADFILNKDYNKRSQVERTQKLGQSETQSVEEHNVRGKQWSVTIIDTPGLADTRGPEKDREIIEELAKELIKFGKFHAFCFVMKADENRQTEQLKQAYLTLKSFLPGHLDNFFLCLTRASVSRMSQVIEGIVDDLKLPKNNIFLFDNRSYERQVNEQPSKLNELNMKYAKTQQTILKFLKTASQLTPYESPNYKSLRKKKNKVISIVRFLSKERYDMLKHLNSKVDQKHKEVANDYEFIQKHLKQTYDTTDYQQSEYGQAFELLLHTEPINPNDMSFGVRVYSSAIHCMFCSQVNCFYGIKLEINKYDIEDFKFISDAESSLKILEKNVDFGDNLEDFIIGFGQVLYLTIVPVIMLTQSFQAIKHEIYGRGCNSCNCSNIYHTIYDFEEKCKTSKIIRSKSDIQKQLVMIEAAIKNCVDLLSNIPLIGYQYNYIKYLILNIKKSDFKKEKEYLEQILLKENDELQALEPKLIDNQSDLSFV